MHICHIIPTLRHGGAERFVIDLSNAMVKRGHTVSIIVLKDDVPMIGTLLAGVHMHVVEKKGKVSLGLVGALKRELQTIDPDIVHTHLFGADLWGRLAALLLRIPSITTEHNTNVDESWFKKKIKTFLRPASLVYTCNSNAVSLWMQEEYGIHEKKIQLIHQGITLETYTQVPPASMEDPLQLLALGRFEHQKGFDLLLDALDGVKDYRWHLHMRGAGSQRIGLLAHTKCLKQHDDVTFHEPDDDVAKILEGIDMVIMPSRWEGLGLVAKEAMAAERFVIATSVGGLPEIIDHLQTGYLVAPENVMELEHALRWAFEHRAHVKKIARQAKLHAVANFDFAETVKEYEILYKRLRKRRTGE